MPLERFRIRPGRFKGILLRFICDFPSTGLKRLIDVFKGLILGF